MSGSSELGTGHDLAMACVMLAFGIGWIGFSILVYQHFTAKELSGLQVWAVPLSVVQMLFGGVMVLFGLFLLFGTVAKATSDRMGAIR